MKSNEENKFYDQKQEKSVLMEQKIIDELTKPSGISHKPSDSQIAELIKRSKTLNIESLYTVLLNKIYCYEQYDNSQNIKSLIKSLYCIYYLLKELDEFKDLFLENVSLIYSIKDHYALTNKKVIEAVNLVLSIIDENNYQENLESKQIEQVEEKVETKQSNFDLFGVEEEKKVIAPEDKKDKLKFIKKKTKDSNVVKEGNSIFDIGFSNKAEPQKDTKISLADSLFNSAPNEIDFTNSNKGIDNIFEAKEKSEREKKLNDLLSQLNVEGDKSQSTEVAINIPSINFENNDELMKNNIVQEQINTQFNYLISIYGSQNKEELYEYAKKVVLDNPLLKQTITTHLNKQSQLISQQAKANEKIILCKDNKGFNSKAAFNEPEKEKDSFSFVNDLLKKK